MVEIADKGRLNGLGGCPSPSRIVVPDCDKLGVRVLVRQRGIFGCMYVPEPEDRNGDRVGHGILPPEFERLPHCQSAAVPPYLSGRVIRMTNDPFAGSF
jgi:hypothetical protein